METNTWAEDDFNSGNKSTLYEPGSYSPGGRKLQEVVFVYQLEPPPSLQAIARQKIRQVSIRNIQLFFTIFRSIKILISDFSIILTRLWTN